MTTFPLMCISRGSLNPISSETASLLGSPRDSVRWFFGVLGLLLTAGAPLVAIAIPTGPPGGADTVTEPSTAIACRETLAPFRSTITDSASAHMLEKRDERSRSLDRTSVVSDARTPSGEHELLLFRSHWIDGPLSTPGRNTIEFSENRSPPPRTAFQFRSPPPTMAWSRELETATPPKPFEPILKAIMLLGEGTAPPKWSWSTLFISWPRIIRLWLEISSELRLPPGGFVQVTRHS